MGFSSWPPPPTPVCSKGPINIEKFTHYFYCNLALMKILVTPIKAKVKKYEKYLTAYALSNF